MKNSKRRGAVKVPNVKLRPAQTSSSHNNQQQANLARVTLREEGAADERIDLSSGKKPFRSIVLCATGDLDKRTLFAHAQELGAQRANDFTDQVTHLVADGPGSAKYRCAVERNLPILKASWVNEAYNTWLNGEIVDLEKTMSDHKLPIFSGVRLCITGMDDVNMRSMIHALLLKEDGVYLKTLDKTATHLLCCASENSPKMEWASEHNRTQAQPEKIRIIWEEWFWDSLEFGGRWNELEYGVTNPRPTRKSLTQIPEPVDLNTLPSATPFQHTALPPSIPTSFLLSDDPVEHAQMYKPPDLGTRIFEGIIQRRGYVAGPDGSLERIKDNNFKLQQLTSPSARSDSKLQHQNKAKSLKAVSDADAGSDSVLTRLSSHRAVSFTSTSSLPTRQPFRRVTSLSSNTIVIPQPPFMASGSTSMTQSHLRLFGGYTFRAFGEAKASTLRAALEEHGGRWLTEGDEGDADFLLVRLVSGGLFWREEDDENERAKFRTECWVEHCIFEDRICEPGEHIVFTPLKITTPVEGSERLHVSSSGLDSAEACWTKRLVRAVGGNLALTFSRHSTHLICPSGRGAKYDKAREWGVSVVSMGWLLAIANIGKVPDARDFDVKCGVHDAGKIAFGDKIGLPIDVKGKGKGREAEEGDGMIVDITNGVSQESQSSKRASASLSSTQTSTRTTCPMPNMQQSSRQKTPTRKMTTDSAPSADLSTDSAFTFGHPGALLSGKSRDSTRMTTEVGTAPSPLWMARTSTTPKSKSNTHRSSAAEIERDKQVTQIPSSHTPSPLKIPSKPTSVASPPISETRGLRTAITALLGKRGTESREEIDGPAQKPCGRSGKRPRLPSKVKSGLEPRRGLSPALSLISGSPPLSRLPAHEEGDVLEEEQPSLRVVYEDPGQIAEKKKLIALFKIGSAADIPGSGNSGGMVVTKDRDLARADRNIEAAPKKKLIRRSTRSSGV